MVQFKKDSYQGIASAMPMRAQELWALADEACTTGRRLKPVSILMLPYAMPEGMP
jgi:hypothetical protein